MNCFQALVLLVTSAVLNDARWVGPGRGWTAAVSAATPSKHPSINKTALTLGPTSFN